MRAIDKCVRTLLYVPIIHTEADLGSMGKDVSKSGRREFGDLFWNKHEETVLGFWDAIARYFDSLEVKGYKVFQDGMVAEDEMGRKIVDEAMRAGSRNYAVIAGLLARGAVLVKTEDVDLVKKEHGLLLGITRGRTETERLLALRKYKLLKDRLLGKRDLFIARRISERLGESETGILFIGAYHHVRKHLPADIHTFEIKAVRKVQEYQKLLPDSGTHGKRIEELCRYLKAEVKVEDG